MQNKRKPTDEKWNMVTSESTLVRPHFGGPVRPVMADLEDPTEPKAPSIPRWKVFLVWIGAMEMVETGNPRLNASVLALLTLIVVIFTALTAGAVQYGRLMNQVDTLQQEVKDIKLARDNQKADDAKYLESRLAAFKEEWDLNHKGK